MLYIIGSTNIMATLPSLHSACILSAIASAHFDAACAARSTLSAESFDKNHIFFSLRELSLFLFFSLADKLACVCIGSLQ